MFASSPSEFQGSGQSEKRRRFGTIPKITSDMVHEFVVKSQGKCCLQAKVRRSAIVTESK
jgi:hypothetical protein